MILENIEVSINGSLKNLKDGLTLPNRQGIYAFFLIDSKSLGRFGLSKRAVYIGISNDLNNRDLKTHLTTGQTGWSTLRRSLGAILKERLSLSAQKRDKNSSKLRQDKYKFDEEGEKRLTDWMVKNLKIGYWIPKELLSNEELRKLEEQYIIKAQPSLDLDRRTRHYNKLADELDELRKICREEVKSGLFLT